MMLTSRYFRNFIRENCMDTIWFSRDIYMEPIELYSPKNVNAIYEVIIEPSVINKITSRGIHIHLNRHSSHYWLLNIETGSRIMFNGPYEFFHWEEREFGPLDIIKKLISFTKEIHFIRNYPPNILINTWMTDLCLELLKIDLIRPGIYKSKRIPYQKYIIPYLYHPNIDKITRIIVYSNKEVLYDISDLKYTTLTNITKDEMKKVDDLYENRDYHRHAEVEKKKYKMIKIGDYGIVIRALIVANITFEFHTSEPIDESNFYYGLIDNGLDDVNLGILSSSIFNTPTPDGGILHYSKGSVTKKFN